MLLYCIILYHIILYAWLASADLRGDREALEEAVAVQHHARRGLAVIRVL